MFNIIEQGNIMKKPRISPNLRHSKRLVILMLIRSYGYAMIYKNAKLISKSIHCTSPYIKYICRDVEMRILEKETKGERPLRKRLLS